MGWLLEQDKKLSKAVSKVTIPIFLLMARIGVMAGAVGEVMVFALKSKDIQAMVEENQLGFFQSYLMMLTGNFWKRMNSNRQKSHKLFEQEFGDNWAEEICDRLRIFQGKPTKIPDGLSSILIDNLKT